MTEPKVPLTGWMFTDAVNQVACPKCGSQPEKQCKTPKGRNAWPPHTERTIAVSKACGPDTWKGPALTI